MTKKEKRQSLISVIIPVYNTSRYLSQCINSVKSQDYQNLEIILVNDASTDKSLHICKKFAEKDKRIIIIDKLINEGLASARRSGLAIASGKYIFHVDSDDWLAHRKVISSLYLKAEETGADYVETRAYRVYDRLGFIKKKRNSNNIYNLIEQPELFYKYFLSFFGKNILSVNIWGKLYRKSFLDNIHVIGFGIQQLGEDLVYNIQLFPHLKKIYILKDHGYCYRYGGLTTKYNPIYLKNAKIIYQLRKKMIETYGYYRATMTMNKELKEFLKSDIIFRIRNGQKKTEIIEALNNEISDPVFNSMIEFFISNNEISDPVVNAIARKDVEKLYEIGEKTEKGLRWRIIILKCFSKILNII